MPVQEAQRALHIPPRDFVPVLYVDETNWTQEVLRFAPTLALMGLFVLLTRGAAGGVGGMRGPGDIFKIGRSPAKKINKELVRCVGVRVLCVLLWPPVSRRLLT